MSSSTSRTLLKAVTAGRSRQIRLLLDLGAPTDEHDDCGQTPLIRAIFLDNDRSREKVMRMLLKKGANVSQADVVGRNALSWACLYGRDNDVALLLEYADVDLDLNQCDINGQTALFHAVTSGNAATVKLLVRALRKYDLSVDTRDNNGNTPLMHANRLGHDVCASILVTDGSARAGIQDVLHKKEKWAVSSLRDRGRRQKRDAKSKFPPISNEGKYLNATIGRSKNRRAFNNSDSDQDSASSSEEECDPGQRQRIDGHLTGVHVTPRSCLEPTVRSCLENVPRCGIPASILASPTSSTLANHSSDDDSEVDSIASTIIEGKAGRGQLDLPNMYGTFQEQISPSYRPTALPVPEPVEVMGRPETPIMKRVVNAFMKGKSKRDVETRKWTHLKKSLRLSGLTPPEEASSETEEGSETGGGDRDKVTALPRISDRRGHLVHRMTSLVSQLTSKNVNKNYSQM